MLDIAQKFQIATTHVYSAENPDLELAKTTKWEVGVDFKIGQVRGSVTYYEDKTRNGYMTSATFDTFKCVDYNQYSAAKPANETDMPELSLKSSDKILLQYSIPTNYFGESSAESCDEQPSCRSRIRGLQQNADQQRSRGVNRERSGRKTQQRVPSEQPDGEHIADDASGGASQAHGEKFTNHNLNICIILRMCKFKQKMITNRSIICRNKWNFCHIWVGTFWRRPSGPCGGVSLPRGASGDASVRGDSASPARGGVGNAAGCRENGGRRRDRHGSLVCPLPEITYL